jgi:cobalt/nickel transport protein
MINVRTMAISGVVLALILAAFVSPFASTQKDGLERVAEQQRIEAAEQPVWKAAPMPDYAVAGVEDGGWATGVAGVVGTLAVLGLGLLLGRLLVRRSS